MPKVTKEPIRKFPRQDKLAGKLRQYNITYEELSPFIGITPSAISAIINGYVDFKLSLARKIRAYIQKKAKTQITLEEIID